MLQLQGFEGQSRIENIDELRSSIIKFSDEMPEGTLSDFLEEVALYTDLENHKARACYQKCGFEVVETFTEEMANGKTVARCMMEMVL